MSGFCFEELVQVQISSCSLGSLMIRSQRITPFVSSARWSMCNGWYGHEFLETQHPVPYTSNNGFTSHWFTTRLGYDLNLGGSPTTTNNNSCHGCGSKIGHWTHQIDLSLGISILKLWGCSSQSMISCVTSASVKLRSRNLPNTAEMSQKNPWVSPTVEPWRPSWKVLAGFSRFGFWEKRLKHVVKYRHIFRGFQFRFWWWQGDFGWIPFTTKILMREPPQQFDVDVDLFLAAKLSLYYWVTTAHIIL
jgi:hypothetical protein